MCRRALPPSRVALGVLALVMAACDRPGDGVAARPGERAADAVLERAPITVVPPIDVVPPCTGAEAQGPLLAFSLQGTHGADYDESLTIGCDGEVLIEAPIPFSSALLERPGPHHARLDRSRLAAIGDLAARLAQPVPVPSLPPQGVDVSVRSSTVPPLSRVLRPDQSPADGEASLLYAGLMEEILASVPTCAIELALEPVPGLPLRAGQPSRVLLRIRNRADQRARVRLEWRSLEVHASDGSEVAFDPTASVMFVDREGALQDPFGATPVLLAPDASIATTLVIVPPGSAPLTLSATARGVATCGAPREPELDEERPARAFTAAARTYPVGP